MFKDEIKAAKTEIINQCKIYNENYSLFKGFHDKIQSSKFDEKTKARCKSSFDELNEGNFRLIFCGQVKSGKSHCIIEFLSGKVILPSRSTPATMNFTHIFYSEKPVMYSETPGKFTQYYEFDGKTVDNKLVGRTDQDPEIKVDLETIYHAGTPKTFEEKSFHIIDTPGLNETKEISEAFYVNLKKLNPQLVVYIFDAGPKFTCTDETISLNLIFHLTDKLKIIFLFNKYDCAFQPEKIFHGSSSDEPDAVDSDEDEETSDTPDDEKNLQAYDKDYKEIYEIIRKKVDENESKMVLIGYSSKLVKNWRLCRDNDLPFLLKKHTTFLLEIKEQINKINISTIAELLEYSKLYLYSEFNRVYSEIISMRKNDFHSYALKNTGKDKLLKIYERSHGEINIQSIDSDKFELESSINDIIKSQEKRLTNESAQNKFEKITKSLIGFLVNRYNNLFSNIIHTNLNLVSFDLLRNEIKSNYLESYFSHTFCTLKYDNDVYNLHSVIEQHFKDQYFHRFDEKITNGFESIESYKEYLKQNLKYEIEYILPKVKDYMRIKIDNERKHLLEAIDNKTKEIISSVKKTEKQMDSEIKEIIIDFRKWLMLSNNHVKLLRNSSQIPETRRELFSKIIDKFQTLGDVYTNDPIIKREHLDLHGISSENFLIIQYFLRTEIISNFLLKSLIYFHEEKNEIFFITNLDDYQPLWSLLPKLNDSQKKRLIAKLSHIVGELHRSALPLDNFGPDMIFAKLGSENRLEVRLVETNQSFREWQFTLDDGTRCDKVFFKYPFYSEMKSIDEMDLSMIYSFSWTVLIVLFGSCQPLVNGNILEIRSLKVKLDEKFANLKKNEKVFETCKIIIYCSLKRPYDNNIGKSVEQSLEILKNEFENETEIE